MFGISQQAARAIWPLRTSAVCLSAPQRELLERRICRAKWRVLFPVVVLAALLTGCTAKEEAAKPVVYTGPLVESENVIELLSDSARLHFRLSAPLEQRFDNGDVVYRRGVSLLVYDRPGKVVVNTITANWAKLDNAKQLYILRGVVRVANEPQQQQLATEELFFNRSQQKIYTDSAMFVRVQTPTEVLTGNGLTANQDFSRYSLWKPIGTFSLPEAQRLGK